MEVQVFVACLLRHAIMNEATDWLNFYHYK